MMRAGRSIIVVHLRRWWWFYIFIAMPIAFVVFILAGIVFDFVTL